ncbi:hypothetical protein FSARC_3336 [Fusarium sarcochroum]|uniref:Uncharacterized protein n=1 Tax=Fusarium sarcochroum TaxID=1208366 RepID=A0A8H4U487_9HYPO|nr:hypothetical protein FSARC_3336 [Fusarium sarcochroum]
MSLQGKVYAITGGASGIGLATAKILAQRGATVSIADIDADAMSNAAAYFKEQGVTCSVSRVDVSQRSEIEGWLDDTVTKHGRLDGAANVAGIIGKHHGLRAVADLEDDEWHKIIACVGFAKHAAYDASKHGIVGLTRAAAKENGHREVRVNAVAPGAIYTPLMKKAWDMHNRPDDAEFDEPTAFQRQGTPEECANVIVFLLGPESTFVSGSVYEVDGAWI